MVDYEALERNIREDGNSKNYHALICEILENQDCIFSDLVKLGRSWDILFVPHFQAVPGMRWWGVPINISADEIGRLKINKVYRFILVPYEDIQEPEKNRKELFLKELELSHEFGHIKVFENEDLANWLNCSFVRLYPERICPYLELRAFEEGIKILEDIMEKYDPEIKTKQKIKKFFKKIYLSGEYQAAFFAECAVRMSKSQLGLETESDFCPVLNSFKETALRLDDF